MSQKILIVEDEVDLANLIEITLKNAGFSVSKANDGKLGLELALSGQFDLIMLDIMLPHVDGLEICRQVRLSDASTPIMMLTARDTETDRIMGLNMGADDYLTKPFSIRELEARIKAMFRRAQVVTQVQPTSQEIKFGNLSIEPERHKVSFNDKVIDLTSTEFDLIHFLAKNPGQVFSRSQLLDSVWGYNHLGYEHTVNSHINRLRAKLEACADLPKVVHTIWGVGYKFEFL